MVWGNSHCWLKGRRHPHCATNLILITNFYQNRIVAMTNYSIVVSFTITLILVVIFADSSVHSYGIEFKGEGGAWHRHNSGYKRSRVRSIFSTKAHYKLHITQGRIQYFPEGSPTLRGIPTYYSTKISRKWRKFERGFPEFYYVDILLQKLQP